MALKSDVDDFHVHGREIYWLCKVRQSESKVSNTLFEKRVKVRSTFRNVNTVARLVAKYKPVIEVTKSIRTGDTPSCTT